MYLFLWKWVAILSGSNVANLPPSITLVSLTTSAALLLPYSPPPSVGFGGWPTGIARPSLESPWTSQAGVCIGLDIALLLEGWILASSHSHNTLAMCKPNRWGLQSLRGYCSYLSIELPWMWLREAGCHHLGHSFFCLPGCLEPILWQMLPGELITW